MGKILDSIKYSYDDITIKPAVLTRINHRNECNPFNPNDGHLPIFTAPMSQIIDCNNYSYFDNLHIIPMIPRNIQLYERINMLGIHGKWCAFGINEIQDIINEYPEQLNGCDPLHICLDIANGHMEQILDICTRLKEVCRAHATECVIMTGNIANPKWIYMINTIYDSSNTPIDYVRCSIGSGNMCITSTQTGIYYPTASLISECVSNNINHAVNIIADGGIKDYATVIKAIGLGADYVMIGSQFAKAIEACGDLFADNGLRLAVDIHSDEDVKKLYIKEYHPYREYYGMSSKRAQVEFGGKGNKTAEGTQSKVNVEYTLKQWQNNMVDYFRSAMSYCDAYTLNDFKSAATFIVNTNHAISSITK